MADATPPSGISAARVTIFIVPPTEAIASLEAPNPLCTCMAEVTSDTPAQLLQYTLPFSISLIGIPLIITAMFSLPKPRMLILESP